MSIADELIAELREAMRASDSRRRDVIRQVQTEVATARTAPGFRGEVGDDLYRDVIASYVKRMQKAVDEYRQLGDRGSDMADKLAFEVEYLARWLPEKLGEDATRRLVRQAIEDLRVAGDVKAAGRVTGHVMKAHSDEVDGAMVSRLAREELGA